MSTIQNFLSNDELQKMAPAVGASSAHPRVSQKYTFVSTLDVVDSLRSEGWFPVRVRQSPVRDVTRYGHQRHALYFRRSEDTAKQLRVGDSIPELLLRNSSDGSSSFFLEAALFRLVCKNGLCLPENIFGRVSVRHIGFQADEILSTSHKLIAELPRISGMVEHMRSIRLNDDERVAFAERALRLRYPDGNAPIIARQLLIPRRQEDREPTLWNILNITQESILRGQISGRASNGRKMTTRPIKSIDVDIKINRGLWEIAESFRRGAAGSALRIAG